MANVLYLSEFLSVCSLISVLCSTSESSSLVIKDPWYTESGNYTCCYAFSNWTGNADCFSSYIVFAATKLILAAACTCGILTSIIVLLICFRKRGQLNRRVLTKMRRRACGAAFSGDASTAASTATREEDGTAGDRTRLNQVFPTGLRLPLLRPLHQLSLHERINRLTDLDFFPARRVQIGNLLYGGCHSRVYSGFVSTVRFVDDVSVPDNRVVLKTLPGLEGLPLIVLEYVDGPNLLEYLRFKLADAGTSVSGSTISLLHYDVVGRLFRADLFSITVDIAKAMAHLTSFRGKKQAF